MSIKVSIVPVTPYQQNCSVLKCEATGKAAIVDPGGDIDRIMAAGGFGDGPPGRRALTIAVRSLARRAVPGRDSGRIDGSP